MPLTQTQQKALDSILASREFQKSAFDKTFLQYLVDAGLRGELPKETTIAIEVFGRGPEFNPATDSIVRSHVYQVRKKLERYYLAEGQDARLKLAIPRGRYQAIFSDHAPQQMPERRNRLIPLLISLSLITALYAGYTTQRMNQMERNASGSADPVASRELLQPFIATEIPVYVVLGDDFVFWKKGKSGPDLRVRDGSINSNEELQARASADSELAEMLTGKVGSSLSPHLAPIGGELYSLIKANRQSVNLIIASKLNSRKRKRSDVLFLGTFETARRLTKYFHDLNYGYELLPHKITRKDKVQGPLEYLRVRLPDNKNYRKDFVIVARMHSRENNNLLLVSAFSTAAIERGVRFLLSEAFLEELVEMNYLRRQKLPKYFQSLLEVNQLGGNEFKTRVVDFQPWPGKPSALKASNGK